MAQRCKGNTSYICETIFNRYKNLKRHKDDRVQLTWKGPDDGKTLRSWFVVLPKDDMKVNMALGETYDEHNLFDDDEDDEDRSRADSGEAIAANSTLGLPEGWPFLLCTSTCAPC
jgi:hypothetical protein